MPIFEYRCKSCGKVSEFLEGVGQGKVEKVCKHCGRDERCDIPPCSDEGVCKR